MEEILIVGAGVAGLACARELCRAGARVAVLDKGRGVGGRCATRRVEGQAVDHGVAFLHGSDPAFLDAIRAVEGAMRLEGWPLRVHGTGAPCQPAAFEGTETRLAFAEGVSLFPKGLARGLDVTLGARVERLALEGGAFRLSARDGEWRAGTVVLALPVEQAAALLDTLPGPLPGGARAARRLLGMVGSVPCLTVLAGYPLEGPGPPWDVCYPEDSRTLLLLSHDSAKRAAPGFRVLVLQAHPRWSRERLEAPEEAWTAELLAEAARLAGDWAARPSWTQAHVWRYARTDPGSELGAPILAAAGGGARIGFAGEVFGPGGGIEAAWLSGRRLARLVMEEGGG